MLLVKAQGGCSIGPYTWEKDGDAVEVDDKIAADLLAIPGGGFSVPEPKPATKKAAAKAADPAPADPSA